jgi:hypothetical protein
MLETGAPSDTTLTPWVHALPGDKLPWYLGKDTVQWIMCIAMPRLMVTEYESLIARPVELSFEMKPPENENDKDNGKLEIE